MMSEFILGQAVALASGIVFFVAEFIRLKRFSFAALEGVRFGAFISFAELTVWLAVVSNDSVARVGIVAVGTILAAIVINNAYVIAYRALADDR